MGGRALKNLNVVRVAPDIYKSFKERFVDIVSAYNDPIQYCIPGDVADKADYGDMDVIFHTAEPQKFIEFFAARVASRGQHKNGNCTSVEWNNFQIDLIYVSKESYDFARNYYAHGTHAALIGRLASYYGFKLGWNGFYRKIHIGNYKKDILLTLDWAEALKSLGYVYYFITEVDVRKDIIFEHIISSEYFSKKVFRSSKPDRNYGFQEEFFQYVATLPNEGVLRPKVFGYLILLKYYPLSAKKVLYEEFTQNINELFFRPIRKFKRKMWYKYIKPRLNREKGTS